ncbi:hypothetical protein SAMN05421734_103282 [Pelagirhabdus alkalitolerans]|uniref:Helix-turn-helix domain of resolvase n=1 Tax=Pelagirhabdus alkalitolerans TaxID=1612202 RepID=A0A1G6HXW9_9BACI|nr:hypothetical protein [Pelagirhabdus alkalitolerans]SDB99149.1 hypothetical protein SAMN05421734_103282 [Pelagirhabdus alkalitolerans]
MYIAGITILIVALLIFIISFFAEDKFKKLEDQIEQLSLSTLQDNYQMKKKIKVLEEELLPNEVDLKDFKGPSSSRSNHKKQVELLYKQGYSVQDISKKTQLSEYDIEMVVNQL